MSGALTMARVGELVSQVADATPEALDPVVAGYRANATSAAELWQRAREVDQLTAQMFVNNGRGVYDAAAATDATRLRLGDGGELYRQAGDAVRVVAEELTSTRGEVMRQWGMLNAEMAGLQAAEQSLAQAAPTMTQPEVDARAQVGQPDPTRGAGRRRQDAGRATSAATSVTPSGWSNPPAVRRPPRKRR